MSKQALAVFSTDWHLQTKNKDQIKDLVRQQCELAKSLNVKYLICTGDVFESRIAQREDVLTAFGIILDIIKEFDLELYLIPGNHDKTEYSSTNSFLTPFKNHPVLKLIESAESIIIRDTDLRLFFIPFFKEEVWLEYLNSMNEFITDFDKEVSKRNILCTHIAVTGSRNNDHTLVSSSISTKLFKSFFKVFSGHYHDQQKIGSNFYHIPSIQQNNFGEDTDKGFTVLYSDGSHELVLSDFKKYIKVQIDLDTVTGSQLVDFKKQYSESNDNVRFEFIGSEKVLKSINKEDYTSIGIDIKTKVKEIIDDIQYAESTEVVEHTKESIKVEFEKFCTQENLKLETGLKYLNKII